MSFSLSAMSVSSNFQPPNEASPFGHFPRRPSALFELWPSKLMAHEYRRASSRLPNRPERSDQRDARLTRKSWIRSRARSAAFDLPPGLGPRDPRIQRAWPYRRGGRAPRRRRPCGGAAWLLPVSLSPSRSLGWASASNPMPGALVEFVAVGRRGRRHGLLRLGSPSEKFVIKVCTAHPTGQIKKLHPVAQA